MHAHYWILVLGHHEMCSKVLRVSCLFSKWSSMQFWWDTLYYIWHFPRPDAFSSIYWCEVPLSAFFPDSRPPCGESFEYLWGVMKHVQHFSQMTAAILACLALAAILKLKISSSPPALFKLIFSYCIFAAFTSIAVNWLWNRLAWVKKF